MQVQFKYRNYRGEVSLRTVTADAIEFLRNPGFDYQPGWFLSGWDEDKNARRSFSLSHIICDDPSVNIAKSLQIAPRQLEERK